MDKRIYEQRRFGRTRLVRWIGSAFLLILIGGCQSIRVHTDFDPAISFSSMEQFAWLEPPRVEGASPFADNDLLRKRLRAAIELRLGARGYRLVETPEEADFLATYGVVLEDRIRDDGGLSIGFGGYRRYGYGSVYSGRSIRNYQESTLIIDILDPATEELLWRGWGSGLLGTRDRDRNDRRLEEGIRQILKRFPPEGPDV